MDQTNKVKTTYSKILVIVLATFHDYFSEDQRIKKKSSVQKFSQILVSVIFHEFLSEDRKKKRSSSQDFYEIRCESTKNTKIWTVNTNLVLDLHSNGPESVNLFGTQFSLVGGGAQFLFGGTAPECPLVAPGLRRKQSHSKTA